ncbi:MAG: ABC transporter substrate-binding protein [Firmicutes bacterium]|nr:ABC transporter substrate-binding protein [Bacillota bacterium]
MFELRFKRGILVTSVLLLVLATMTAGTLAAEKVSFRLNWVGQGSHAPFFLALENGYFAQNGLKVEILEGSGSATTVKLIGNKSNDFGWADAGTTILAAARGVPIKTISALFQSSSFAVITGKDSGITQPKDLEGKRVAMTSGDALSQLFPAFAKANNIDINKVQLTHVDAPAKVGALMENRVDAILGGADDQPLTLAAKGFPVRVLRFADFGTNTIGMSIIAHEDTLRQRPQVVRGFLDAVIKGWDAARKNPDAAIAAILKHIPEGNPEVMKNQLMAAFTFLFSPTSNTLGKATAKDWENTIKLLSEYRGLPAGKPATAYYTNEFLPNVLPGK